MSNEHDTPPPTDARARENPNRQRVGVYTGRTPAEVDECVNEILDLLVSGDWSHKRAKEFADEHGVAVNTVHGWTAQAARILRIGTPEQRESRRAAVVSRIEKNLQDAETNEDRKAASSLLGLLVKVDALEEVRIHHTTDQDAESLTARLKSAPDGDRRIAMLVYHLIANELAALPEEYQSGLEAVMRHYLQTRELPALVAGEEEEDGTE